VSGLSTDPTILEREIARGRQGTNVDLITSGPSAVFQRAARLLIGPDSGMTSSLASALYQVLANQSGAALLGATTDHSGRQGVGVSLSSSRGVSELIIDPTSASALEVQFSPPLPSLSGSPKGPTIRCIVATECGSSTLPPENATSLVVPIWTDSVTSGIVNSIASTEVLPPNTWAPTALAAGRWWRSFDLTTKGSH